jgi:hypothetical protein
MRSPFGSRAFVSRNITSSGPTTYAPRPQPNLPAIAVDVDRRYASSLIVRAKSTAAATRLAVPAAANDDHPVFAQAVCMATNAARRSASQGPVNRCNRDPPITSRRARAGYVDGIAGANRVNRYR